MEEYRQWQVSRREYIDQATREMMRCVDKRWRGAFNNREIVSITQKDKRLVLVARDGTIWRKNPGTNGGRESTRHGALRSTNMLPWRRIRWDQLKWDF